MKILITSLSLLILTTGLFAQNDAISRFYSAYEEGEGFTKITMGSKMFQMFMHLEGTTEQEKQMIETVSKIEGMKILALENDQIGKSQEMYKSALKKPSSEYETLMTVEDEGIKMSFFIRESNGKVAELLMISGGPSEFMIMSLLGDIDLNQIANLGRSMNIEGMNKLQFIEE
jgi:hypothetical protein